jgi:hypothetical protein
MTAMNDVWGGTMNDPKQQLNEQQMEDLVSQLKPEAEAEQNPTVGIAKASVTGGKGPGLISNVPE